MFQIVSIAQIQEVFAQFKKVVLYVQLPLHQQFNIFIMEVNYNYV